MKKFRNGGFENGGYSHKVKLTSSQWKYPGCFLVKIPSSNGAAIPLPCSNWRVPFSTEVFVLVAWFKWRVWRVMLSGMHSSSNPFDKRPHSVFSLQEFRLDDFFFYKNWGQHVMTWNCWRWLLTFHHCLGEIWDCLIRVWGPAFEWWEGRRDAQGFFGLTWPQKQSSL